MAYFVIVPKKVQKELKKIDSHYQKKIRIAFLALAGDPHIGKKLEGNYEGQWSLRVWPYRIIYEIHERKLIVLIIRVGHRQGVYK
jgi:mRNA interferase RelE/StbE